MGVILSRISSGENTAGHLGRFLFVESIGGGRSDFVDSESTASVLIESAVRIVALFPLIAVSLEVFVSSFLTIGVV